MIRLCLRHEAFWEALVQWRRPGLCVYTKLESSVRALSCEQANVKEQKQQIQNLNGQLREQLESTREELQAAKSQLNLVHATAAQELVAKERWGSSLKVFDDYNDNMKSCSSLP